MKKYNKPQYYRDYLKLTDLLNSQQPVSQDSDQPAHDEMLFIITHQAYELWFKQILHELNSIIGIFSSLPLDEKRLYTIVARLRRITRIQRVINQQIGILETMTPLDFLDFRDSLIPASGFQSVQFREIELRLGLPPHFNACIFGHLNKQDSTYLQQVGEQNSIFELLEAWLSRTPFLEFKTFSFWDSYSKAVNKMLQSDTQIIKQNPLLSIQEKERQLVELETTRQSFACLFDTEQYAKYQDQGHFRLSHKATLAALFIQLYRDEPILQLPFSMLNLLMDIDEHLSNWRSGHALMVQRMVGTKIGTGGSSGHDYLKSTVSGKRIFSDLFNLSTYLIPRSKLPELPQSLTKNLGFYQPRR